MNILIFKRWNGCLYFLIRKETVIVLSPLKMKKSLLKTILCLVGKKVKT